MLPAAFLTQQELLSFAGGIAAAIAVGAFVGQALDILSPGSDLRRRRLTAAGGFIGLMTIIGLILFSAKWR